MYSVVPKPASGTAIMEEMAEFIQQKYPTSAGIVYTCTKKEANNVADALCDYGVVARVSASR